MKLFFERAMHNMNVELRKWLYRIIPCLTVILLAGLAGGTVLVTGCYLSDGRLLIWKITSQAIAGNPWGEENGRIFSAIYSDAQERYFTDCEDSDSEAWVV